MRILTSTLCMAALAAPAMTRAQALFCPAPALGSNIPAPALNRSSSIDETPIELNADGADLDLNPDGWMTLDGATNRVAARQGDRAISADQLRIQPRTREMIASGSVNIEDSTVFLTGSNATLNATGGAQVEAAGFVLKSNAGRGSARKIELGAQGNLALDGVQYTTCQEATPAWRLKLSDLDINQQTRTGTGRNVRLEIKGIPVFYTPWISFPVGDARKSGFLFPIFGGSSRGGQALSIPWYWNIAPQYDATLTPTFDTARGFRMDSEFRYLDQSSKARLLAGYLPRDSKTGAWRGAVNLQYQHDLLDDPDRGLRLALNGNAVRDKLWYEDFGASSDQTSQVYLGRALRLDAQTSHWRGELLVQSLQTLDDSIALTDRPYTQLPRLSISGAERLPLGMQFALDSELSYFTRGVIDTTLQTPSVTGARLYLQPQLSLPLIRPGMYLKPGVRWHYSRYQLQDTASGADRSPSLSAPTYTLDAGVILERLGGKRQQRLYTLEPRLLYVYVPYRTQNELPLFDTGIPDLSLELFRTNRFLGPDRVGDANQLSAGLTTRMLNSADGTTYLSGTLGGALYFSNPCVTSLTQTLCNATTNRERSSDLIGELSLAAYKNLSVNMGIQWDPNLARNERGHASVQYRTDSSHVVNLGYRFERGSVEQWESSFAWPLGRAWSGYGRVVYSRLDKKVLDRFVGMEYRSCCFNVRAVVGRAVTTRSGQFDTQYKLQLELKGLSSVGTADAFLEGAIAGYSARQ